VFIKGDVTGRVMESVAQDVKQAMSTLTFPKDYFYRFGGDYEKLIESKKQLTFAILITIALIYMVLAVLFESFLQPVIILMAVPLASIGVYAALELTHKPLSQMVFIGIIMLTGIVVSNSILLIDRMNMLRDTVKDRFEILRQAGMDRLRPIAMTTISSLFGFFPMAVGWGQAADLWSPLAIAVIGGLFSSSILTLFIVPNICLLFEDAGVFFNRLPEWLGSRLSLVLKRKSQ
jgi:HAE1 family hydrophobic/amphiphilic exporter-1